jgi:hypothetical protein
LAACSRVYPGQDTIELTLGGREELVMSTNEAGLRHCVTEFTSALHEFEAAAAQPDETSLILYPRQIRRPTVQNE